VGRTPRRTKKAERATPPTVSRHVPDAIKRAVYERDSGQCAFVDARGRRCPERGFLQIDHVSGFAREPEHSGEACRLLCAAHNQHAAELLYGRSFMDDKRKRSRHQSASTEHDG
jgi:5-methylcytosine-specific restriction endonuclease McrA